jgi:hypothetical protein
VPLHNAKHLAMAKHDRIVIAMADAVVRVDAPAPPRDRRGRQGIPHLKPLAGLTRIALESGRRLMMEPPDCAQLLRAKSWATIRGHCSNNARLRS